MTNALLGAGNSQYIDHAFMNKLVAVNDNLEAVAVAVSLCSCRRLGLDHNPLLVCLVAVAGRIWECMHFI